MRWWWAGCVAGATWGISLGAHAAVADSVLVVLKPQAVVVEQAAGEVGREQALAQRRWEEGRSRVAALVARSGVQGRLVGPAGAAWRLDVDATQSMAAVVQRLRQQPEVWDVVPNERLKRLQAAVVPSDPLWSQQWHLQAAAAHAGAVNLPAAWARWTGQARPVTVAVVDTGARYDHPDLAGRLLPGYDMVSEVEFANDGDGRDADASDPGDWVSLAESRTALFAGCEPQSSSWHGTFIAGEVAAVAQNGLGGVGVNWGARVLPVRVAGKCGALLSDLLDGLRWAAGLPVAGAPPNPNPARVINLSYGGSGPCNVAYQQTLDEVRAAGALVVVAAGNDGGALSRPADCRGVLTVTAVRADGAKAAYASVGANVALAAPGGSGVVGSGDEGLLSTADTGSRGSRGPGYKSLTGTSFAAPLAAGVASLVWSVQPTWSVEQVEAALRQSARPHVPRPLLPNCSTAASALGACNCTPTTCGTGLLDAAQAVVLALDGAASAAPAPPGTASGPGSASPAAASASDSAGGGALPWGWGLALWAWALGTVWWRWRKGPAF